MNDIQLKQEAKNDIHFLIKRSWDFIDRIEKLQIEIKNNKDNSKYNSLIVQLQRCEKLLDDYKKNIDTLSKKFDLDVNILKTNQFRRDIISITDRKTKLTRKLITNDAHILLRRFFDETVPTRNRHFTGRNPELTNFFESIAKVTGGREIVSYKGIGGIGKTEIAKELCHIIKDLWDKEKPLSKRTQKITKSKNLNSTLFSDGIIWIQFEATNQSPLTILDELKNSLFFPYEREFVNNFQDFFRIIQNRDILFVLDSIEQNLRAFDYLLEYLRGNFQTLITSRVEIPGVESFELKNMELKSAVKLFKSHAGISRLNETKKRLVSNICDDLNCFPLLIKIMSSLLQEQNLSLSELRNICKDDDKLLLTNGKLDDVKHGHENLYTCFKNSFKTLSDKEELYFLYSSLFNQAFTPRALEVVINNQELTETSGVIQIVDKLNKLSLVTLVNKHSTADKNTYSLHPLLKQFANSLLRKRTVDENNRKALLPEVSVEPENIKNIISAIQSFTPETDKKATIEELINILRFFDVTLDFKSAHKVLSKCNSEIKRYVHGKELEAICLMGIRSSAALNNLVFEIRWRYLLTNENLKYCFDEFKLKELIPKILIYCDLALDSKKHTEYIYSSYQLCEVYNRLQDKKSVLKRAYLALRYAAKHNKLDECDAIYSVLSVVYSDFNSVTNVNLMQSCITSRLIKFPKHDPKARFNLLNSLFYLGTESCCAGDYETGIPTLEKAMKISRLVRNDDIECISLNQLLHSNFIQNNFDWFLNNIDEWKKINERVTQDEEELHFLTGLEQYIKGDYDESISKLKLAISIEGPREHFIRSILSEFYLEIDNFEESERLTDNIIDDYIKSENFINLPPVYLNKARLQLIKRRYKRALKHFLMSMEIKEKLGLTFSNRCNNVANEVQIELLNCFDEKELSPTAEKTHCKFLENHFFFKPLKNRLDSKSGSEMILVEKGFYEMPTRIKRELLNVTEIPHLVEKFFVAMNEVEKKEWEFKFELNDKEVNELAFYLYLEFRSTDKIMEFREYNEYEIKAILERKRDEFTLDYGYSFNHFLYDYYVDEDLVSTKDYLKFCEQTGHHLPTHLTDIISSQELNAPIVNISIEDAKKYAKWAEKIIPTESEWTKACSGSKGNLYPWGNTWSFNKIKPDSGEFRMQYERTYNSLNANVSSSPGLLNFEPDLFEIPENHLDFDEPLFLKLLQGSLSLSVDEKRRILNSIPELKQDQIKELIEIFREEKDNLLNVNADQQEQLEARRRNYYDSQMSEKLYSQFLHICQSQTTNSTESGIQNLVGVVYQLTVTTEGNANVIKGGSWFSENPEQDCKSFSKSLLTKGETRMDVGFRCVKPTCQH